ncbi:hypothetical protein [Methanospirillum hungatei]|uniref:hypothetical protein n=1 Tax=Methanospirillum hungatei TaxID=2203 RepID=UPI00064E3237|nr:hypothetical protein [Methanospirillum hungatei]
MNPNTLKRLIALENIRKTVSPGRKGRSHEEVVTLLTDVYPSVWSSDATLQTREERYHKNLELLEEWSHTSLQDKLQKHSGLFNEI